MFPNILHSFYGKRLGLSVGGAMIMDGRNVIGGKLDLGGACRWYDHFTGAALSTHYTLLKGSDGSAVNPAISLVKGGRVRLTNASAGAASMAVGGCQIAAARNWEADKGNLLLGTALNLSTLTNMSVFVGLTDKITLEAPFSMSGTTLTSNATDGFGFLFDGGATAATTWKCVGVKNNTDATTIETGVVHVAGTDDLLAMECDAAGTVKFYINGILVGSMVNAVTVTVALTETIASWVRTTAAANTVDCDFLSVEQAR